MVVVLGSRFTERGPAACTDCVKTPEALAMDSGLGILL